MIVICTDFYTSYKRSHLTINKQYEVTDFVNQQDYPYYEIIDDYNIRCLAPASCFMTIEDFRNDKLNKILE